MKNKMGLISLYISEPLTNKNIENVLGVVLKKGIEATHYAEIDGKTLTITKFKVLTLINWSRTEVVETLKKLGLKWADDFEQKSIHQDYPIHFDPELSKSFTIDNDKITLKEHSILGLIIISHVISQSVALEVYEKKLSDYYEISRNLIDESNTFSIFGRAKLSRFAKELVLIRHDMLIDLFLLDKPNILWDNEDIEALYNGLFYTLELKDRFDVVEHKLNSIKDDIVMVMDLANHNHSSFLEWIIIILILIEIIMGLMEWFKN